jgi:hypothetical protein
MLAAPIVGVALMRVAGMTGGAKTLNHAALKWVLLSTLAGLQGSK